MAIDHDWPDDPDEEIVIGGEVFARRDIEYKSNWYHAFRNHKYFDFEKMRKNKEARLGPVNNIPVGKPIPIVTNIASESVIGNKIDAEAIVASNDWYAQLQGIPTDQIIGQENREALNRLKEGHFHKDERSIEDRMTAALGVSPLAAAARVEAEDRYNLPDNNPKTAFGIKKPPLHLIPKPFLIILSKVMGLGAKKYGAFNWRSNQVAASVYLGALERHVASWADGESIDPESGVSHLAHAAACIAILLDAQETGNLVDDRPPPGAAARLIKELSDA